LGADGDVPRLRGSLGKGRMEAFSDGVFSIAATLLVFDIAVHPPGTPLQQVLNAWPAYAGYVVSFLTIGGAWLGHTTLTDRLERTDPILLRLNLLLLFVVAFLPFPTRLVADGLEHTEGERVAVALYGTTLMVIHLLGYALVAYARGEDLFVHQPHGADPLRQRGQLLTIVISYGTAILIGLVWPAVAVALYFALAIYLIIPLQMVRRLFSRS
jgi:uncharacterized membrane protein